MDAPAVESSVPSRTHAPRSGAFLRAVGGAVTFAVVLAIGLSAGWYAARQGSAAAASSEHEGHEGNEAGHEGHEGEGHEAGHEAASDPDHGEADHEEERGHEHGEVLHVDPRTVANMGVEAREAVRATYVDTRDVAAEIVLLPEARRPVHSPVRGRVLRLHAGLREVVAAGDPVAEILREPFPRPTLFLTDALIRPLNEEFHRSIGDLRTAVQSLSIVREEIRRIRTLLGGAAGGAAPALPGKVEVDLLYEERRATVALENARREAERHGLTREEIATVEGGGTVSSDLPLAQRVLSRNSLWSPAADRLLAALPEGVRAMPYAAAVIGELVGTGRLDDALVAEVAGSPEVARSFLDVAGLLQGGLSAEGLRALREQGALASVTVLRAPPAPNGAPDWDVVLLRVREGAQVEAGDAVIDLVDARQTALRLAPVGAEIGLALEAVRAGTEVEAEPLVAGSGPLLHGVALEQVPLPGEGAAETGAIGRVANEPLCGQGDATCRIRSWRLRPGLRYVVHVPIARLPDRFVLPAEAVVARGIDSIVMLEDGDAFRPVVVRVERQNARDAVLADDGAIHPGDRVVVRGAYALSLALQASAGAAVDPHAGHNH